MKAFAVARHLLLFVVYGLVGIVLALLVVAVVVLDDRPDLAVWHTADLDEEYRVGQGVDRFEDYLALEDRLFAQLDRMVYDKVKPSDGDAINRYARKSLSDPSRWERNWNRTFELPSDEPVAGVLLLHGLTDSPYSLRSLGAEMHDRGAWVLGLRIPGHGTAPSGLAKVKWQDMAGAVELAAVHLREKIGDKPLYVVGYSNGGALAVQYALSSLRRDATLPKPDRIVLMSPEIGVTKAAALASWQGRLGRVLGLRKLEWTSILPEYDPYKYNSFAVNAGDQVYRLTTHIRSRIEAMEASGALAQFPPVLAFQSAVDATVSMPALVEVLFDHLPENGSELVLFDINRLAAIESILAHDPKPELKEMLGHRSLPFAFTAVTNKDEESEDIVARTHSPGHAVPVQTDLGTTWPDDVYSLAHIALPFRKDDPLYGDADPSESPGIALGNLALRGEKGVLRIAPSDMLRLHWNPFYAFMERRTLDFLRLPARSGGAAKEPRAY